MVADNTKIEVDTVLSSPDYKGIISEATFGGVVSFYRRRYTKDLADIDLAITGVPFDSAVTNRPGTRFGPRAIREASVQQAFEAPYGWDFNPLDEFNIADYGDCPFDHGKISEFPAALEAHITGILDAGAASLTLGGDHYITYPILRAYHKKYGPLSLIQFDAHSDTWPDDDMERIDHGTMFYKAVKNGLVVPERSVQVGIRTTNSDPLGVNILDARSVHLNGPLETVARIKKIVGDNPVYLTFDIDALDPAYAPGTGTPVWGGLTSAQASIMLRDLAGINVIGMDVVEVSPQYDVSGATAIAGAHVATELMCLWASNKMKKAGT